MHTVFVYGTHFYRCELKQNRIYDFCAYVFIPPVVFASSIKIYAGTRKISFAFSMRARIIYREPMLEVWIKAENLYSYWYTREESAKKRVGTYNSIKHEEHTLMLIARIHRIHYFYFAVVISMKHKHTLWASERAMKRQRATMVLAIRHIARCDTHFGWHSEFNSIEVLWHCFCAAIKTPELTRMRERLFPQWR